MSTFRVLMWTTLLLGPGLLVTAHPEAGGAVAQATTARAPRQPASSHFERTYYCQEQSSESRSTRKYRNFWSDVFSSAADPSEISTAWRNYLTSEHHLARATGGCSEIPSRDYVKGPRGLEALSRQRWEQTAAIQHQNATLRPDLVEEHTVVDTGWKYTGGPAVVPAAQRAANSIDGTYKGTYRCGDSRSIVNTMALSLTASGSELTGVFTLPVPPVSGRPVGFSVSGTFDAASGAVHLRPGQWLERGFSAPMMGLDGSFDSRTGQLSGRIDYARCGAVQATFQVTPQPLQPAPPVPTNTQRETGRGGLPPRVAGPSSPVNLRVMTIEQFDRMTGSDQIEYVDQLLQHVVDAVEGDQLERVKRFMGRQAGEARTGMDQFQLEVCQARIDDLNNAEHNPAARRVEIKDVLYATMAKRGIVLPAGVKAGAIDFRRARPLSAKTMSMDQALRAQAETVAYVGGRAAELEHPKDAAWVKQFRFDEPSLVGALFTGDFSPVLTPASPGAQRFSIGRFHVLTYIASMNEHLGPVCKSLYDPAITRLAEAETGPAMQGRTVSDLPGGGTAGLRMLLERQKADTESGENDAAALARIAPGQCSSVIIKTIYLNMGRFVRDAPH